MALLTTEEARTVAKRGSEYPDTFEDAARDIALRIDTGARGDRVASALAAFQVAVNALWEHALPMVDDFCNMWGRSRRKGMASSSLTHDDVRAEVQWAVRHAIVRYDPARDSALRMYAKTVVFRHLDEFLTRSAVPVELSRDAVREGNKLGSRMPLNGAPEEEPPLDPWRSEDAFLELVDFARTVDVNLEDLVS